MRHTPHQQAGWVARAASLALAVIGAFLIVLPLATGLPGKSDASGRLMTAFRPAMTTTALAQAAADQQIVTTTAGQLSSTVLPALAAQLHVTPAQLSAQLAAGSPAFAKGMSDLPAISTGFGGLLATMQAQQSNFQQADQIPTGFMAPTSMTWLFVIPGAVLLVLGGLGTVRPSWARRALVAGGALGLVMVIGLISVSMYGKASAADEMNAAFKPVFAPGAVQQTVAWSQEAQAMTTQLTHEVLPDLAAAMHVTPAQLSATLATSYPAVATGLAEMPAIVERMAGSSAVIAANADNYAQTASIPWAPGSMVLMFWFMMAPALVGVVIGVGALAAPGPRVAVAGLRPHGVTHA